VQLFYLASIGLLIRHFHWPDTVNKITLLLIIATLFLPSLQHTIWGQFNTIGVLSLILSYLTLRQGKDGLAGVWAVGLTFKPQATLLPLLFLLSWALWQRRWRFLLGFTLTSLMMEALAEFLQPGWVGDFIHSLKGYVPVQSAVDHIWNPFHITTIGLLLVTVVIFVKNRNVPASSVAFAGCLTFYVAVWSLIVPIVGMLHIVIFPPILILLLISLKKYKPNWYLPVLLLLLLVYFVGWFGFLWGLSDQALYDQHILWPESVYKIVLPVLAVLFSLTFCLRDQYSVELL
jgi:hypothetical protein